MVSSNIQLLVIPDAKNNEGILTGKLFEYLAAQKPILLIGPLNGDAAKIVSETGSGYVCGYNEKDKIAEIIIGIYKNNWQTPVAENNLALKYSREELTRKMAELI
jgi:hypothetical protein